MSTLRYRPEIDGLRALSVIGVLLFHVGLGLPGGFVGVDVFFVISGYLITGIILKDLERGTFSMADFWVRRIKRILPAVGAMVLVSLLLGYWLLTPAEYENLAKSSVAQSLMAANVFFWRDVGYFTQGADYKPLLHTWSLAVEEQFYVVFPLGVIALWKWRKRSIQTVMWLVAAISLILSVAGLYYKPEATFFLLPTRAWELLAGSLLAYHAFRGWHPSKTWGEVLSWTGLVMITATMCLYTHSTSFPGLNALLPVVGAVCFILGNQAEITRAGKLLSFKPVVFIGLISYSLYLWHWPVLAFARSVVIDINLYWKLGLVTLSVLLGVLSWRYIETPFRKMRLMPTKRSVYAFAVATSSLLLLISVLIWQKGGMPNRVDEEMALLVEDIDWTGSEYVSPDDSGVRVGATFVGGGEEAVDFALWGDSHGMAVAALVDELAHQNGLKGIAYVKSGTPPVPGISLFLDTEEERERMIERNQNILSSIECLNIKNLILVACWGSYFDAGMFDNIEGATEKTGLLRVVENREGEGVSTSRSPKLGYELNKMLENLNKQGVKVWVLRKVPSIADAHCAKHVYMLKKFPKVNEMNEYAVYELDRTLKREFSLLNVDGKYATVVDSTDNFFEDGNLIKLYGERSYYRDSGHLTRAGAYYYLKDTFSEIFTEVKRR